MWQVLTSEAEVVVQGGFLYLPLLFDAEIEEEVAGLEAGEGGFLWREGGRYFIKTLGLRSLVENYPAAWPDEYEGQRLQFRQRLFPEAVTYRPAVDARLRTILFDILPHFWRRRRGRRRAQEGRAGVLAYLAANLPENQEASRYIQALGEQRAQLQQLRRRLESLVGRKPALPPNWRGPARGLAGWFQAELQGQVAEAELSRWQGELDRVQELLNLPETELRVLLTVAVQGAVEADGCGCGPDPHRAGEFTIYVRTGDYLLQDYFGRPYFFPDCRVAVSTAGPFHPMVLETYKHPLLRRFKAGQRICLTDYQPELEFSAAGVIRALEEGMNALFYGYNSRKRNGYNSLDEYGRHHSVVDFADRRLVPDDRRLGCEELEVKNRNI